MRSSPSLSVLALPILGNRTGSTCVVVTVLTCVLNSSVASVAVLDPLHPHPHAFKMLCPDPVSSLSLVPAESALAAVWLHADPSLGPVATICYPDINFPFLLTDDQAMVSPGA
jgi:hypothetical protein